MDDIKLLREKIDKIDAVIIKKLAAREKIVKKIGIIKASGKKKVLDTIREKKQVQFYKKLSAQYQIDSDYITKVFKLIILHSRNIQKNVRKK